MVMMIRRLQLLILFLISSVGFVNQVIAQQEIDLAGTWHVKLDSLNTGLQQQWYKQQFQHPVSLPGMLDDAGIGKPPVLSIDKLISSIKNHALNIKNKNFLIWSFIFVFSLTASFFAGHLQIFFYLYLTSFFYFIARWLQLKKSKKILGVYLLLNILFLLLTSIQWLPTLQFILASARNLDQDWHNPGWFIPWQNL